MYAGDYLSSNLGHEIINLFQADNGHHYLYLNSSGNLNKAHEGLDIMLMVKAHSADSFEVIGLAKGLHVAPGATMTMPRDISQKVDLISRAQRDYIASEPGGVSYGGVSILDIFNDAEQQNIFITYKADKVLVPSNRRIFLQYDKNGLNKFDNKEVIVALKSHNMPRTSLKSYIYPEESIDGEQISDYDNILTNIVENADLWTDKAVWKPLCNKSTANQRISLFDICKMRDDENRVSNALAYFMSLEQYRPLWIKFFGNYGVHLHNNYNVGREISSKITDESIDPARYPSGGRIDLLIEDSGNFVVIENKIKSDINNVKSDGEGMNQLHRYINFAQHKVSATGQTPYFFIIAPNYNIPVLDEETSKRYRIITYRDICEFLDEPTNMAAVESDWNFRALYDVMKWHTFDSPNEYLRYEMQEKFEQRLKTASSSISAPETETSKLSNEIEKNNKKQSELNMAKKSAISGEYIITVEDSGSIRVCKIYDNVKASLRECAEAKGFEYDPNWTTRQFGSKLIKEFGEGNEATIGEYTIVKRDSGSIETYRTYDNTLGALREIASKVGFNINESSNTRQNGSKLIDFINSNK